MKNILKFRSWTFAPALMLALASMESMAKNSLPSKSKNEPLQKPIEYHLESLNISSPKGETLLVIGVVNLSCPCSRESFSAFKNLHQQMPKGSVFRVYLLGMKDSQKLRQLRAQYDVSFDLELDLEKKITKAFKTQVTPSVYILKGSRLLYASAIIDPSKDPSPNYALQALEKIKSNLDPESMEAFGCRIWDQAIE